MPPVSFSDYEVLLKFEQAKRDQSVGLVEFSQNQELTRDSRLQLDLISLDIEIRLQLGERVEVDNYYLEFPHLGDKLLTTYNEARSLFQKSFCPIEHRSGKLPGRFGHFDVIHEIGRGGMGVVYHAMRRTDGLPCALKVLFFNDSEHEAGVLQKISHPYVCKVYECGVEDGLAYLALELIEGRSIKELANDSKNFSSVEVATLISKLARGLQNAHNLGIIHFDISTDNVQVASNGDPMLIDFGLATVADAQDTINPSTAPYGTLEFMAPEITNRKFGSPGTQSDIYSLGVVMYVLLTNYTPFRIRDFDDLEQACTRPPPRPSDFGDRFIDERLESICLNAMQKNVADRIETMLELSQQLDNWLDSHLVLPFD